MDEAQEGTLLEEPFSWFNKPTAETCSELASLVQSNMKLRFINQMFTVQGKEPFPPNYGADVLISYCTFLFIFQVLSYT